MTLPRSTHQRESDKFVEDGGGNVAVRVKESADTPALPSGASTEAKQDDIIATLTLVDTEEQETVPTDASKNNPSFALTYDGSNQPTLIAMTIGGVTYNRTLTWTSGNLTAMTAWSAA